MVEQKFQIATPDYLCGFCRESIPCGGEYVSGVLLHDEAFSRRDYCPSCWARIPEATREEDSPAGPAEVPDPAEAPSGAPEALSFYAFWRARRPDAPNEPPRRLRFDAHVVLDFFRHLAPGGDAEQPAPGNGSEPGGAADPAGEQESDEGSGAEGARPARERDLRFVLSLLLIRKKVLNFQGSRVENGREWLKLSEKADPDRVFWVENPELSDEELERVREDIAGLLQMNV